MSKPVIFTALEFYTLPSGNLTYHTHYVAACSRAQAVEALQELSYIDFSDCWISTDNQAVVHGANQRRTDELDAHEYARWQSIQCRPYMSEGQRVPAVFHRVRAPLRAAA